MNKCEWKDGKFEGCDNFDGRFLERDLPDDKDSPNYCLYCQKDIRKPAEPLIVKSGGTWAIYQRGINYLWTGPPMVPNPDWILEDITTWSAWKPFTEITLDDEIAKLRPMVTHDGSEISMLVAVTEHDHIVETHWPEYRGIDAYYGERLATPHELQEPKC